MIDHVLPRMACSCAIFAIALAHCGCQSMSGSFGGASTSSKPTNPNDRETNRYVFQKKAKPKPVDPDELKGQFAAGAKDRQSTFETSMRLGNAALQDKESNRLDEARREYEKALAVRPGDPDCHHRLAVVADKLHQFGVADDHYEAALKKLPHDPNLLSDLGYSYFLREGDDRRAEATLNDALKISPGHKGAMGNLGVLYARQGRPEDAIAMFQRNGVPEADAQQYMAKLFPQRQGAGSDALAQNSQTNNARSAPPVREEQPDYLNMKPHEVKELMNRKAAEAKAKRSQELFADASQRRDWTSDPRQPVQAPQQNPNQPLVLGPPGSNQPPNSNPNHLPVVTPNGGNATNPAFANNNGSAQGGNPFGQEPAEGPLTAQPGTNPNIGLWGGAPIQQAGGAQSQFNTSGRSDVVNVPFQPPQNGMPAQQLYLPSNPRQRPLSGVPGLQPSGGSGNPEFNANMAAAQMGMNAGPGALFPVMPADTNAQSGFGTQGQPSTESRFGHEYSSPPQFQNSGGQFQPNQFQPNRTAVAPSDPRQGSFNPKQRGSFADYNDGDSLSPQSPGSNWPVAQATAMSPSDPSAPKFNDSLDRSAGQQNSAWAEKPSLGGAAPFTGAWPPGSQGMGSNRTDDQVRQGDPRLSDGAMQNSLPMWNGGQSNTRPQPRSFPAVSNQQSYVPEQWPGSAPR